MSGFELSDRPDSFHRRTLAFNFRDKHVMGLLRNSKTLVSRENESGTLDEFLSLLVIEQTQSGYI